MKDVAQAGIAVISIQSKAVLVLLLTGAAALIAQSVDPMPDTSTLVRRTVLQQRFAESREQDYVFRQDTNDIRLRKECTWAPKCPAPFGAPGVKGVAFQVVRYTEQHFEVFWLDGVRMARVLPSCDGCGRGEGPGEAFIANIPISESELAFENQRVDREMAEAMALRAKGENASSPDDPPQILLSRMLELCSFSNPRRELINGRSTILLDFGFSPTATPRTAGEGLLKVFTGTVGIDEQDHAVQHVEGRFLADVDLAEGNVKIRKGTRITISNKRVDAGIWLLARVDALGEGRYFAFSIDGAGHIFTGNYRKFHGTLTILPAIADALPNSSAPPLADLARLPAAEVVTTQSRVEDQGSPLKVQTSEYWVDPATGLMWAAKDNGKDVSWKKAVKYCHDSRLAGYSDWRLATIAELKGIYDQNANAPGLAGPPNAPRDFSWHVKGRLFLTGNQWSSPQIPDDRGRPSGYAFRFDFNEGEEFAGDETSFSTNKRALCVRGSEK